MSRGDATIEGPRRAPGRAGSPAAGRELRARGQRTVRKLLDAGIEVFGSKGYHAARVDDIVRVADTSHGTFYLYFANKEDLFRALVLDVADELRELAESVGKITADDAGRAELRRWLEGFAGIHARYGPVIKAWTDAEIDDSELGRLGTSALTDVSVALARRVAGAPSTDVDAAIGALALVAMVERMHYYVLAGHVGGGAAALLTTLEEITFAALFGAGPAS